MGARMIVTRATTFSGTPTQETVTVTWSWSAPGGAPMERVLCYAADANASGATAAEAMVEAQIASVVGGMEVIDLDFRHSYRVDAAGRRIVYGATAPALSGAELLVCMFQADLLNGAARPVIASYGEIARRLGVSPQVVSAVRNGRTRLRADAMASWAARWAAQGGSIIDVILPGDEPGEVRVVRRGT